jgi:hypothetical protein
VVSTIAFGTGINIASVRSVTLYYIPEKMDDVSQLTGRAGRDRQMSMIRVYYSPVEIKADCPLAKFLHSDHHSCFRKFLVHFYSPEESSPKIQDAALFVTQLEAEEEGFEEEEDVQLIVDDEIAEEIFNSLTSLRASWKFDQKMKDPILHYSLEGLLSNEMIALLTKDPYFSTASLHPDIQPSINTILEPIRKKVMEESLAHHDYKKAQKITKALNHTINLFNKASLSSSTPAQDGSPPTTIKKRGRPKKPVQDIVTPKKRGRPIAFKSPEQIQAELEKRREAKKYDNKKKRKVERSPQDNKQLYPI